MISDTLKDKTFKAITGSIETMKEVITDYQRIASDFSVQVIESDYRNSKGEVLSENPLFIQLVLNTLNASAKLRKMNESVLGIMPEVMMQMSGKGEGK